MVVLGEGAVSDERGTPAGQNASPESALWSKDDRQPERELFADNLPVRIHHIIMMIRWTGLAPWGPPCLEIWAGKVTYRGTSLIRNTPPVGPYGRTMRRLLGGGASDLRHRELSCSSSSGIRDSLFLSSYSFNGERVLY